MCNLQKKIKSKNDCNYLIVLRNTDIYKHIPKQQNKLNWVYRSKSSNVVFSIQFTLFYHTSYK